MNCFDKILHLFTVCLLIAKFSEAAKTKYTIVVKTGTKSGAGTDANVKVKLYGASRTTGELLSTDSIKLKNSQNNFNKFEKGKTDTFKNVEDDEDLNNVNKIEVKRDNWGLFPDWLLDEISVITYKGETYTFKQKVWLKKKDKYYSITQLASTSIQPATSNLVPAAPAPPQPVTPPAVTIPEVTLPPSKYPTLPPAKPVIPYKPATVPSVNPVVITPKVKYSVSVQTGRKFGSGTDADVYIKIFGTSETTGQPAATQDLRLTHSNFVGGIRNLFESGQTDSFLVEDTNDLINLNKIAVRRTNSGPGPNWYLEKIVVSGQDGKKYIFPANRWIDKSDTPYEFYLEPVPSPTPSNVLYNIIIYTGPLGKSGSGAKVYLTLYGARGTSSEIHLRSPSLFVKVKSSGSKVFQARVPEVGPLSKIMIRQDSSGEQPNWKIEKVLIIVRDETVYEFLVSSWLEPNKPLVKTVTISYPATSMKFIAYPTCIQPVDSSIHPDPASSLVLLKPCGRLFNFFKLYPDGVIQHLVSGLCVQGTRTGDPKETADGDGVILNYPCTLYRPGYTTPRALQFKFSIGGSLMEMKSGKCVSTDSGQNNVPLSFTSTCDTANTKLGFIDKKNNILYPEDVGKSPTITPSPPPTPAPLSSNTTQRVTVDINGFPGNSWPSYCPSVCSSSSCASNCQPSCCASPQQATVQSAGYPAIHCPSYCSAGQCRSECPVGCCAPNPLS